MKDPTKKKFTKKQAAFVQEYVKPQVTGTAAVMSTYDAKDEASARAMASELLSKPHIAAVIADRIPADLVAKKHLALLNKMETIREVDPNTKDVRLVRTNEIDGKSVSKALELYFRTQGAYQVDAPPAPPGNTYNFFYKPQIRATTDKYEEELKKILYADKTS